jgi:hypothetical protein
MKIGLKKQGLDVIWLEGDEWVTLIKIC